MPDSCKVGCFISEKRKELGLTQKDLSLKLNVSFQSISKWETGKAYPNVEILSDLAKILGVTVDELLSGNKKDPDGLSYSKAGIDIAYTDSIKSEMAKHLATGDRRVLNGLGPFASLYDIDFPDIKEPVLVLKSEEPGSKQKLAMEYGYTESICHDMVNHLVNDVIVMGARPLAVLDTIVCGKAEKSTISSLVKGVSDACRENECSLVGGETSIQPSVVDAGVYVLTSSIAGIVEKKGIIDGSAVKEGDAVIAVASNGLHTNGYSLVRMLLEKMPQIKLEKIGSNTFIEEIMKPHTPYYRSVKDLFGKGVINAMAHITGGGIAGNLCRVIPDGLSAAVDLPEIRILPVFGFIKEKGNISDAEMLNTFNMGVGLILVVPDRNKKQIIDHISKYHDCYEIGKVVQGTKKVVFRKRLNWV
ncbi:MAG: phosphoribosylformylglycinamidine cyclo-ligase [Saccharofermentans sp.]|nr:phosphoribosylformylglycinamidine cyclo-ligase [Saccharofermentans sp.]